MRFGLGLSATHIRRTDRRDRLLLLFALAHALLTLLGEASERSGCSSHPDARFGRRSACCSRSGMTLARTVISV
jgi:hypothetical protein